MNEEVDPTQLPAGPFERHRPGRSPGALVQPTRGVTRRQFLETGAVGSIAAAFAISYNGQWFSPAEAKAQELPLAHLTDEQAALLEAFGEVLLPGARDAGIANFVDTQLGKEEPLLSIRYFDWPLPLDDFYAQGLAALDNASIAANDTGFATATPEQQAALVGSMLGNQVTGWEGPPAPLVYLAMRLDAMDVVYGTVDGFALLDVPYMPHILPEERW